MSPKELIASISTWPAEQRRELMMGIRAEVALHPLEEKLGVKAETILEAIARAPDLTLRGIKGIIAEAVFSTEVLPAVLPASWKDVTPPPDKDRPFDALVSKGSVSVRIQVKNQRVQKGAPKMRKGEYVVETQKTRKGTDSQGKSTRPYYRHEFDLLAVCLWPSSGSWRKFVYCRMDNLTVRPQDAEKLQVYQFIPADGGGNWTFDLAQALATF